MKSDKFEFYKFDFLQLCRSTENLQLICIKCKLEIQIRRKSVYDFTLYQWAEVKNSMFYNKFSLWLCYLFYETLFKVI